MVKTLLQSGRPGSSPADITLTALAPLLETNKASTTQNSVRRLCMSLTSYARNLAKGLLPPGHVGSTFSCCLGAKGGLASRFMSQRCCLQAPVPLLHQLNSTAALSSPRLHIRQGVRCRGLLMSIKIYRSIESSLLPFLNPCCVMRFKISRGGGDGF